MKLYDFPPKKVTYNGKCYKIKTAWPNVLAAIDALNDESLSDTDQIVCTLNLLVKGKFEIDSGLLKAIFNVLMPHKKSSLHSPVMDFEQDAELIYSAFLQTYNIDLQKCRFMHWCTFWALLNGLPENTRFCEIVSIRQMDVPAPTKYNRDQITKIMQQKNKYAIKNKTDSSLQNGLSHLFNELKSHVKGGD